MIRTIINVGVCGLIALASLLGLSAMALASNPYFLSTDDGPMRQEDFPCNEDEVLAITEDSETHVLCVHGETIASLYGADD